MSKERLIVFVKAPRRGAVKTRVAETAGAEKALQIYQQLVAKVLGNLAALKEVQLRFTPDDAAQEIEPWLKPTWKSVPQGEGDLGERLARAFAEAFAEGAERVVIIGSDCPETKSADVRNAWRELNTYDLVVGPAMDGGYWLIGLRAAMPELFSGIKWSTEHVLGETLARAKSLGLKIQLLRILSDVDTEADWNAYVQADG